MSTKSDYTEDEWEGLLQAPVLAGSYIMASDVSITAMGREMKAMFKTMTGQDVPEAAQDLVGSVVADIIAKSQNKEKLEAPEIEKGQDPKQQMLDSLQEATAVLGTKATAAEAAGYKAWVMQVAQATAEAGKEGGFLGIGAVRVSDKEQAALDELQAALG